MNLTGTMLKDSSKLKVLETALVYINANFSLLSQYVMKLESA
jgi:hypothetical protein